MSKPADVQKKATELEPKFKSGNLFLEGHKPTAADVKAFNDLLGAGNENLYRWVKNMASYTEAEKSSWAAAPAPAKKEAKK
jgi:elongation factor 1-beta